MGKRTSVSRRRFLQCSAALAAAATDATHADATDQKAKAAPGERVVIGLIGAGDFGRRQHLNRLLLPNPRVEVAAVCDVDQAHREFAARDVLDRTGKRVGVYKDFRALLDRKDIDAVVIVTPDHWHAVIAVAAMQAGKDVYCEKPMTLTIDEGKTMVDVARRYGAVFQTGSQQRSDRHYYRRAYDLVRAGAIGKVKRITTHLAASGSGAWRRSTTPPSTLDWNMWLGPAPYANYSPDRCHFNFRHFSDYSGGLLTDHGAHENDVAQWLIGADGSGPTKINGTGSFHENGPHDVARAFEITFTYGKHDGVELVCTTAPSKFGGATDIYGDGGRISVSRRKITASEPGLLQVESADYDGRLLESYAKHYENWLDCIQKRERPICDVVVGHRSATVCHLGNLAIRLGRPLTWDPDRETFVNDPAANRLLSRPMRAPWHV